MHRQDYLRTGHEGAAPADTAVRPRAFRARRSNTTLEQPAPDDLNDPMDGQLIAARVREACASTRRRGELRVESPLVSAHLRQLDHAELIALEIRLKRGPPASSCSALRPGVRPRSLTSFGWSCVSEQRRRLSGLSAGGHVETGLLDLTLWRRHTRTMQLPVAPRGHRDEGLIAQKLALLDEPHIRPVSELVREIRRESGRDVPYVDPTCGGVQARVLLLLEAPAAAAAHRSGMLSPDNNDGTAANVYRLYESSGLRRGLCLHWNVVPWYIGSGGRIRAASRADVLEGQPWLTRLIQLLPDLRLVVAMGSPARDGFARYLLSEDARLLHWLAVPHPSQRVLNANRDARPLLEHAFRIAAHLTQHPN